MKYLFLDDSPERHKKARSMMIGESVVWTHNYEEAVAALQEHVFDIAFLDHDLSEQAAMGRPAPGERTGTDVAEFIAQMPEDRRPKRVVLHSFNDPGRRRMAQILVKSGLRRVYIEPFGFGGAYYPKR